MVIIESNVKNEIYNIAGGFEQTNIDTVKKIIKTIGKDTNIYLSPGEIIGEDFNKYLDLSYSRKGQDVRYALCDKKLKKLGWKAKRLFDYELPKIVEYYKDNFIW